MKLTRGLTIFSLFVMIIISGGSFSFFMMLKKQVRSEIRELIRNGEVEKKTSVILLDKETEKRITWLHEDEFLLDGDFYDVISISTKNGTKELIVINDGKEKKLFEGMAVFSKKNKGGNAAFTLNELTKFFTLKFTFDNTTLPTAEFRIISGFFVNGEEDKILPGLSVPPTPPPDQFS